MAEIVDLARKRRTVVYGSDPAGTLAEALAMARNDEAGIAALVIVMIDAGGEEFYLVSDEAETPAMLGAIEILKAAIIENIRAA
jgi:hypothetical protein